MAAKQHPGKYAVSGLDPDFAPFEEGDFDALAKAVRPTQISVLRARFAELVVDMNNAALRWKVLCDVDTAPTGKQERAHVERLHSAAKRLSSLVDATFDAQSSEAATSPQNEQDLRSIEVPYDQARIDQAIQTGGVLPDSFPDDPTADGAWSVPLVLVRLLEHFSRHYAGDGSESRHFKIPGEALNELAIMLQALAAGAADRLVELADEECDGQETATARPFEGRHRSGMAITLGGAKSPNHALFMDLIPVYKELVDAKLGRSRTSPAGSNKTAPGNKPSGPAVNFYGFVFDRLGAPQKGRSEETILDWIAEWIAEQEPES